VGVKHAVFIHAVRVAVSGTSVGPSLFHMLEYLGKERVVRRLKEVKNSC
jgi:glutamyl/glutaminyl-tRNA synthetase